MPTIVNDKYASILQSAIEVITEKGLNEASISDIVKRAGVAQGTFYLYFRSKNALIPAIAENFLTTTLDKIKNKTDPNHNFWAFLKVCIDEVYSITDEYKEVVVLCYSGLAIDYSMELWESIYKPYYTWFEGQLIQAISSGEVLTGINVQWTAKMIINLIENAAERFLIGRDQDMTLEQSKVEVFQFLMRSLERTHALDGAMK